MKYFLITQSGITIHKDDNSTVIVPKSHLNYTKIEDLITAPDEIVKDEEIMSLVDVATSIKLFTHKEFTITNTGDEFTLEHNGEKLNSALSSRIVYIYKQGGSFKHFLDFYRNLMNNPSKQSIDELYDFLTANNLPITEDGHFLAYKVVTKDFKDIHSNTFDNSVGAIVQMPREDVDDDRTRTCSNGLHFAAYDYLKYYGKNDKNNTIVIVKINPKDVVSIPEDYNNQKGRCCKYTVLGAIEATNSFLKEGYAKSSSYLEEDELYDDTIDDDVDSTDYDYEPDVPEGYYDGGGDELYDDEDDYLDEDVDVELNLENSANLILLQCIKNKYNKLSKVKITSSGSTKYGIRIDNILKGSDVDSVVSSYMFRSGTISEELDNQLRNNGYTYSVRKINRVNKSTHPKPCVLVYKIDKQVLNKFSIYTPLEANIHEIY